MIIKSILYDDVQWLSVDFYGAFYVYLISEYVEYWVYLKFYFTFLLRNTNGLIEITVTGLIKNTVDCCLTYTQTYFAKRIKVNKLSVVNIIRKILFYKWVFSVWNQMNNYALYATAMSNAKCKYQPAVKQAHTRFLSFVCVGKADESETSDFIYFTHIS